MTRTGPSILALFAALAVTGVAQAASVEVHVTGIASAKGQIVVSACDKGSFLKTCSISAKTPATPGAVTVRLPNVPAGDWAFMAFHDEDGDGAMKKTALGLPADGVGLSRAPKARFGPPRFDDAKVEVGATPVTLAIGLKY